MEWREENGVRWIEAELPGARAGFTTRLGGVSEGPYRSLNLGLRTGDGRDAVRRNRARAAAALGLDAQRVLVGRQVHGTVVAAREEPERPSPYAEAAPAALEADGQVAGHRQLAPLVLVADCLPIALAGGGVVAMLHGGWRGLAGGIVARGVEITGASAAAIGPGIGPCCYEVGEEVLDAFSFLGDGIAEGRMLDLREVATRLLRRAGVGEVEVSGVCVSCEEELFFSHRRDAGKTGRQGGFAWLEG